MRLLFAILSLLVILPSSGQDLRIRKSVSGVFSLGGRSSIGLVNDGQWQKTAFGTGGQFRIRFSERVNTDWFMDFLTADLSDYAWRTDVHIGWNVLYYLSKNPEPFVQPYILAGHCFEYLKFTANNNDGNFSERYSASIQAGLGTHFNITKRFDISLVAQYMMHIGTKMTAQKIDGNAIFNKRKGTGIQDHVLLHLSLNYKITDLW